MMMMMNMMEDTRETCILARPTCIRISSVITVNKSVLQSDQGHVLAFTENTRRKRSPSQPLH